MNTKPWIRLLRHPCPCFEEKFSSSFLCGADEGTIDGEIEKDCCPKQVGKWAYLSLSLFLPPQRPSGRLLSRQFFVVAHSSWGRCERLWVIFCCGLRCMKHWACASHSRALGGEGQISGQIPRRCQQLLVQGKGHAWSIALNASGKGKSEVSRQAARISLIFSHMQDI